MLHKKVNIFHMAQEENVMPNTKRTIFAIRMLLTAIAGLGLASLASAQITPSADAYTSATAPATKYGSSTLLNVESGVQTAYIQFNLASIPSTYTGSSIERAMLKLYVNSVTTAGSFDVDLVASSWSEATINANGSPTLGSNIVSGVTLTPSNVNNYILIDVTTALTTWLNGTQANYGIALVPNSPLNASFDSKENTATSHPAELNVFFASGGTISGITTPAGSGLTGGGTSGSLNLSLTTSCAVNQILEWNGNAWACATPSSGSITVVNAGSGLTGGGASGNVTLSLIPDVVPLLSAANTFTGAQTILGDMVLPAIVSASQEVMLASNPSGSNNTFLGGAGTSTTSGLLVGVGSGAFGSATAGQGGGILIDDTAIGNNSLSGAANNFLTGVGLFAGQVLDGSVMVGNPSVCVQVSLNGCALGQNEANNTFLGAGSALSTGSLYNATAIGADAEVNSESNSLVLGCVSKTNGCAQSVSVGIGTTTPQQTLDVSGGNAIIRGPSFTGLGQQGNLYLGDMSHMIGAQWGLGLNILTYNDYDTLTIYDGNFGGIGGSVALGYFQSPPTNIFAIQQGYGAGIADGWNTYSSRRWKTNIETLHGALDKVDRLRGVSYDTKSTGEHEIGVIAEEVGAVVPEVVSWEDNGKDARSVDYARLTALLIEATKERQTLIQQQRQQIRAQRKQIKAAHYAATAEQVRITQLASQVKTAQAALAATNPPNPGLPSMISQMAGAFIVWIREW
jgi:Chaperone of endosialidase